MRNIILILLASTILFSCKSEIPEFSEQGFIYEVINSQTERYERIKSFGNFGGEPFNKRDELIINGIIENTRFIIQKQITSDRQYHVDSIISLKILDSLKVIDVKLETVGIKELILYQFEALTRGISLLSISRFDGFDKVKIEVADGKPTYLSKELDSVKIRLLLFDHNQLFRNVYSINGTDSIESDYYIGDNFLKIRADHKGRNTIKGRIHFYNSVEYSIPYEFEYYVQ